MLLTDVGTTSVDQTSTQLQTTSSIDSTTGKIQISFDYFDLTIKSKGRKW